MKFIFVINKFSVDKSEKNGIIDSEGLLQITALHAYRGFARRKKMKGLRLETKSHGSAKLVQISPQGFSARRCPCYIRTEGGFSDKEWY